MMTTPQFPSASDAAVLARVVIEGVRRALPLYGELCAEQATEFIAAILRNPADSGDVDDSGAAFFRELGIAEHAAGHDLGRLGRSYHAAGRFALPVMARLARRPGTSAAAADTGVEGLLRCIDIMIRVSTAAYREAQAPSGAQLRADLLTQIVYGRPRKQWNLLATRAGWTAPEQVFVVALDTRVRDDVFGPEVLADLEAAQPYALVPAGTELALEQGDTRAAIGPVVEVAEAATSLRWARRTLELMRRQVIEAGPIVRWSDHLTTHWLLADEALTAALVDRCLAPIADLPPGQREKLADTLFAVLGARTGAPEVAEALGVHPQTVRNRMRRLKVMFGAQLDDPRQRLGLRIALRADPLIRDAFPASATNDPGGHAT